jgi:hypothetical protein
MSFDELGLTWLYELLITRLFSPILLLCWEVFVISELFKETPVWSNFEERLVNYALLFD